MTLKRYKPATPSLRHRVIIDKTTLSKEKPIKRLTLRISSTGGRNNQGKVTVYHRGGNNHKKKYRIIDFKRQLSEIPAIVIRLEYDPNRSAFIALIKYKSGALSYILAPKDLKIGDSVVAGKRVSINIGNCLPLYNIPVGTVVHNIELKPGKGGQLIRAAGSMARVINKNFEKGYSNLLLMSGELRMVNLNCCATIGRVSNTDNKNTNLGKAGAKRWLGKRPIVRGVAMNPIDHPHGGGEGRTSGGRPSVTPWGKVAKGQPTRNKRLHNKFIITRKK